MAKRELISILEERKILNKIYIVRGENVMLDRDLAEMYSTETKVLKQAVKRNISRFPKDFMFEMTAKEFKQWRENNNLSEADKQGLRYAPFCFTEQGVTMLSCILNSTIAIDVNIKIIRVFTRMKQYALTHKEILVQLAKLEKEVKSNSRDIENIFTVLKELIAEKHKPTKPRESIGFKVPSLQNNEPQKSLIRTKSTKNKSTKK